MRGPQTTSLVPQSSPAQIQLEEEETLSEYSSVAIRGHYRSMRAYRRLGFGVTLRNKGAGCGFEDGRTDSILIAWGSRAKFARLLRYAIEGIVRQASDVRESGDAVVMRLLPRVLYRVAIRRRDILSPSATKSVFDGDRKQVVWCMQGVGDNG
jgi:hypothetical protein